jgi:hypothetical protein
MRVTLILNLPLTNFGGYLTNSASKDPNNEYQHAMLSCQPQVGVGMIHNLSLFHLWYLFSLPVYACYFNIACMPD